MLIELTKKALERPSLVPRYVGGLLRNPRFALLKLRANGMLSPYLYKKLYRECLALPDLPFVDVGAASGATTISAALAFRRSGKVARVVGIEKCQGGSRDAYGDYQQNLAILERNLANYGVYEYVRLYTQPLDEGDNGIWKVINAPRISGFMHDADGRLHRDFGLFYERTVQGGLIVVDDCPAGSSAEDLLDRGYTGKFVRAGAQWNWIEENGFVENVERFGDTVFARKPAAPVTQALPVEHLKTMAAGADALAEARSPSVT